MPVCKSCMKLFKSLTTTHVKKHGFDSLDEYKEATKDIEIPDDLQEKDDILREEQRVVRSKMVRKQVEVDQDIKTYYDELLKEDKERNESLKEENIKREKSSGDSLMDALNNIWGT